MSSIFADYQPALYALATMGGLMLVQIVVADVLGIRQRHIPGTPVAPTHADSLFRASRTVANTNESIAIFVCAFLLCLWTQSSPEYTAASSWAFVACRSAYAVCYYANLQTLRSVSFGLSLLALAAMLCVGLLT